MAEIDSVGNAYHYASLQAASAQTKKQKEVEKTSSTKRTRFSELLKSNSETSTVEETSIYPAEIQSMSLEDATIFLKEEVEKAGNALSQEITIENLETFKEKIKAFLSYMSENNFEVTTSVVYNRRKRAPEMTSPLSVFSSFQVPPQKKTKTSFTIINKKLDELTREMLSLQADNLKILAQIQDIKGMIIDLID